jgi:WD40 repeat protein
MSTSGILDLSFNQNATFLSVGHNVGCTVFKLSPKFEKRILIELDGGLGLARMLNTSNYFGFVGGGDEPFKSKDNVVIWNDKTSQIGPFLELENQIRNLHLTKTQIIAVLEDKIYVAALRNAEPKAFKSTITNEKGICEISTHQFKSDSGVETNLTTIVTLGTKRGEVAIWKFDQTGGVNENSTIEAHRNSIQAVAINREGSMIATASEAGTNIHIYSTQSGQKIYELRRGTTGALIYDIAFDWDSNQLCAVSSSGTIHFWDLPKKEEDSKNTKSLFSFASNYVSYLGSIWSRSDKPHVGDTCKMICKFDENDNLHLATYDGNYYRITSKDGKYNRVERSKMYIGDSKAE